ncbi:DUF7382 domain-containing protein [Halostagnicola kamekurae]|uniref:DUF7382 domain-containing protein n=1 Tax=Halostagnicola kamekurae TaxID=619731 RepID=A0A1I6PDP1_9EURY|nr:hypothetical protein [Halostagnicola kamekurae]SFS38332.1 hypothetical protein SAMN04488556_0487 [Halostagnicola kamekurae]
MRSHPRFHEDERAIEGLPIRLVIALVVGVACLGIMMNMLSGIGTLSQTEVDVEIEPTTISADAETGVDITVIGDDGNEVEDATVIVSSGSASIPETVDEKTDDDGTVTIDLEPEIRQGQGPGTLEIDVHPPTSTDYVDEQANSEIIVTEN